MKIRSLRLDQFRKFTSPVEITGLVDGVNVLAGENEFGKSTLLAAIRGVLFERHTSKAGNVKAMQHHTNKTFPVISLEFELPTGRYKIDKRFLSKEPYAHLTMPDGSVRHGEAAEDELQTILNFTKAGSKGSNADNIGMWAALWVTQKDSSNQPDLTDSARQTIHGCLEEEVGAIAGGLRGKKLLAGVRAQIAEVRDGRQKPHGNYQRAIENQDKAKESKDVLQLRQKGLVQDIGLLQAARAKLANADTSGEEVLTAALLMEAERTRDVVQGYEDRERDALGTLRLCESRLSSAAKDNDARNSNRSNLSEAQEKLILLTGTKETALIALNQAQSSLKQQKRVVDDSIVLFDKAAQAVRDVRTAYDLAVTSENLQALEARLDLAKQAQTRVNGLVAHLSTFSITDKDLTTLRSLDRALSKTQAVLDAQATHVTFDLLPSAAKDVEMDGKPVLAGGQSLINDALITIAGVGSILLKPGIRDREVLLARQADDSKALRTALRFHSVVDVDHAERNYADRQLCEQQLAQAHTEVTTHTLADKIHNILAGIDALQNHIAVLRTQLQAGMTASGLQVLPPPSVARECLHAAERSESEASGKVANSRAPIPEIEMLHTDALRQHAQLESKESSATNNVTRLTSERDQMLSRETSEALTERFGGLSESLLAQQSIVSTIQRSRPGETVAGVDGRIARLQLAKEAYLNDRRQTEQEVAILENRIEREEGVGIEEQVSAAVRSLEALDADCSRFVRELKILDLLLDHLVFAEQAAKERYMAPIVSRVTPYLQTLFPGATISCDEEFKIIGVVRELEKAETFDGLSIGTQEQIAVLTRLAFADMLAERGQAAMVILDDALVYSDPARMERMFDILTHAAIQNQILIFTCRGEIFNRLGGYRLQVNPATAA